MKDPGKLPVTPVTQISAELSQVENSIFSTGPPEKFTSSSTLFTHAFSQRDFRYLRIPLGAKRTEECAIVVAAAAGSIFEREAHFPYEAEKNRVGEAVGRIVSSLPIVWGVAFFDSSTDPSACMVGSLIAPSLPAAVTSVWPTLRDTPFRRTPPAPSSSDR